MGMHIRVFIRHWDFWRGTTYDTITRPVGVLRDSMRLYGLFTFDDITRYVGVLRDSLRLLGIEADDLMRCYCGIEADDLMRWDCDIAIGYIVPPLSRYGFFERHCDRVYCTPFVEIWIVRETLR